ncbi:MAG: hypothetical protein AB7O92_33020 [Acidimicrobiia bacterium]
MERVFIGQRTAANRRNGRRRLASVAALPLLALALTLPLAACGESSQRFVSNRSLGTFFRLPDGWPTEDLTEASKEGRVEELPSGIQTLWHQAFGSGDPASIDAAGLPDEVVGQARVYAVSDYYRETFSLSSLRSSIFLLNVDPVYPPESIDSQQNRLVDYRPLEMGEGLTGSRVVANLDTDPADEGEAWVTQDVTILFDDAVGRVYVLSLYCSGPCYERNRSDIDRVVGSFMVRNDI